MAAVKSQNIEVATINKNFIIQVINVPENVKKLIGAGQYHKYVSEELKIKHFNKVLEGGAQKYTFLIRNRLKINFYSK